MLFTILTRHLAQIETYEATSNLSNNSLTFNFFGDPVAASGIGINSATILKYFYNKIDNAQLGG
jgi:hypothetical protein